MRSQFRLVMSPEDEREFAAYLLSDESLLLIDGPRWSAAVPTTHRSIESLKSSQCLIWSPADRPTLTATPAGDSWYCDSESYTIQFLRSQTIGSTLTEGRLAIGTSGQVGERSVERRFRALVRHLKLRCVNSVLQWVNPNVPIASATRERSANPSEPDPQLWVAPHALRWLSAGTARTVKQFENSIVEARIIGQTERPTARE